MRYSKKLSSLFLIITISILGTMLPLASGQLQYDGYLQTRKLFLFGPDNGFEFTQFGSTHNFLFQREFDNVPRVGLALYTIDFEYSPDFSSRITADTNRTATAIKISSRSTNKNNRLYIMYIATDNQQIGIFVPDRLETTLLSLPTRTEYVQNFNFNFKEQVSQLATSLNDIVLTVYLTGISTTSEMTNNGFPTNRTSISIKPIRTSTRFYTVQVQIGRQYPFILVDWVQCTVVYFIPQILQQNRYQVNSGAVTLKGYGGSRQPIKQSVDLLPLQSNNRFQNLQYFFGISSIQCKDGASITLLGVEKYYTSESTTDIRLLLQMQTWKLVYMESSSYNYIQYKSLKCTEPNANCPNVCSDGVRPFYVIENECNFCHYSCLTCNITNLNTFCDTCHETRSVNPNTNLCQCIEGYYQTFQDYICQSCFPCKTCDTVNTCKTCIDSENMVLNSVTSQCLCKQGFYGNFNADGSYNASKPCLPCSENCLYCTGANVCVACAKNTFLHSGKCLLVCNANQRFNSTTQQCQTYNGDLFDQQGRLSYDWSYRFEENQMVIDLVFSQKDMTFYYYQNGVGYTYAQYQEQLRNGGFINGDSTAGSEGSSSFFYDDGIQSGGYIINIDGSSSGGGSSNSSGSSGSSGGSSSGGSTIIDQSALLGQYYGLGETAFFQRLYSQVAYQYRDEFGIPYGKYRLAAVPAIINPNYVDALSRNLVFKISDQIIPYTMQGISSNTFRLRTRPTRTYINALGAIQIKNAALCRSGNTALQITRVVKDIDRYDYYTASQLNDANNLRQSNETLVDILWGICKYLLFIGFGWPFIPLMLAMQYIMSFNYINSSIPLNLNYFLASFRDFRNPSLLYKAQRDEMDSDIFTHPDLYKSVAELEQFDRGTDFMFNSFQFFFIPFLAVILLGLLALLNLCFRKCCHKDLCVISKFLVPRLPLLIGAYALVQALPVSFFFFSQLKDITWRHPLQPSVAYPTFTVAMAFLAFFLTCAIPILLLAAVYYMYNYGTRISKFSDANVFNRKFLNKIQSDKDRIQCAHWHDPLWGGDHIKPSTYIFGAAMFILPILFGFFLAYFIHSFAWQLTGIILFTALMLIFAIAAGFFKSKIFKIFFIIFFVLMLAYLLVHAGLGSNRATDTYDQWNTGYFGIGLIYALLLTALLFSAYLLYRLFKDFYHCHKKYGCWIDTRKQNQIAADNQQQVQRVKEYRRDTKLKSTFLKSGINGVGLTSNVNGLNTAIVNNNINNSQYRDVSHVNRVNLSPNDNLYSEERIFVSNQRQNLWEQLQFKEENPHRNEINYISSQRRMIFGFPLEEGRKLRLKEPLFIDGQNRIYGRDKEFLGYYSDLVGDREIAQNRVSNQYISNQRISISSSQGQPVPLVPTYQTITTRKQIYVINGQQYEKIGQQHDGRARLKHPVTGQIRVLDMNNFRKAGTNVLEYRSTSHIIGQESDSRRSSSKIIYPTRHIIYRGEEYLDLGYEPQTQEFKLLNVKTNQLQRVNKPKYVDLINDSFNKRLIIDNQQYDYEGSDSNTRKTYLVNTRTNEKLVLSDYQYREHVQANRRKFRDNFQRQIMKSSKGLYNKNMVIYQGEQYEELGIDAEGRHRLYNPKERKHILISDYDYRNLHGSRAGSDNLLLLQSAVGAINKKDSVQQQEKEMRLDSQTSRFYIFQGDRGSKIYIPKDKIDTELPIEIDQYDNIKQNNRIIVSKEQSRRPKGINQYDRGNIVTRGSQGYVETRQTTGSRPVIQLPQSGQSIPVLPSSQSISTPNQYNYQKQQVSAGDVINPNRFYKILGIPSAKVKNFEFKSNDIYLTEKNIKGKDVMARVERILDKYSDLAVLVRGESDESEEYWLS